MEIVIQGLYLRDSADLELSGRGGALGELAAAVKRAPAAAEIESGTVIRVERLTLAGTSGENETNSLIQRKST